jgi:hypothetical protein
MLVMTSLLSILGVPTDDTPEPLVTVEHATASQTAEVDTAIQRFADANLTLPDLNVRFSDNPADCYGYLGTFVTSTTPWTITICSDLAFVPTHELAHAWLERNVDAETRDRYLHARHIKSWDDKRADWNDRGVEDAAFIIQQNLMITPPLPLSAEWQRRADAYELLTSRSSPQRPPASAGGIHLRPPTSSPRPAS